MSAPLLPRHWVRRALAAGALVLAVPRGVPAQGAPSGSGAVAERYRAAADRLIEAATRDSAAYRRLTLLVDKFGHRFSGTPRLEAAIDWVLAEMKKDGLQNVRGEPVRVPRWVRGAESAELVRPRAQRLHLLGLGGSVGTPAAGITAGVLVVNDFADLRARAREARGKIVVYDVPFPPGADPFTTYGRLRLYRGEGADSASRVGAVASLIRSVTPYSMRTPHTGAMRYDSTGKIKRIPHGALAVEDVEMLHRMQDRGEPLQLTLKMGARQLPDAPSRNAVAELVGSERPDEVVVLGGHIDSWDVGQGAMDDGGGSVAAWEAVRLMKQLGLRPRRTVRVVLWTNEEFGLRGGLAYRDAHRAEVDKHVLAMESDGGVFKPSGFRFQGSDSALAALKQVGSLLARIGSGSVTAGEGEADVSPILALGVPGLALDVDPSRYFWYHHTEADTIDKLDPREVALCVATMAVMAYVVADMPDPLPRATGGVSTQ